LGALTQTLWAFDKEFDTKTGEPIAAQFPFDTFMHAHGTNQITQAVSVQELAQGKIDVSTCLPD